MATLIDSQIQTGESRESLVSSLPVFDEQLPERYVPLGAGGFAKTYLDQNTGKCLRISNVSDYLLNYIICSGSKHLNGVYGFQRVIDSNSSEKIPCEFAVYMYDKAISYSEHDIGLSRAFKLVKNKDGDVRMITKMDKLYQVPSDLSIGQVALSLERSAKAIEEMHSQGIIHRDLKDEHLMEDIEGSAKLVDFDLAIYDPFISQDVGILMGTAHYMSPEQIRSEVLDKRTDVYSFGIITAKRLIGSQYLNIQKVISGKSPNIPTAHIMVASHLKGDFIVGSDKAEQINVIADRLESHFQKKSIQSGVNSNESRDEIEARAVVILDVILKMTAKDRDNRFDNCITPISLINFIVHHPLNDAQLSNLRVAYSF